MRLVTSIMPLLHKMFTLRPTKLASVCHRTPGGEDPAVRVSTKRHSPLWMLRALVSGLEAFLRSINPTGRQASKMASEIAKVCGRPQCGLHRRDRIPGGPSWSLRVIPQALARCASNRRRLSCSQPAPQASPGRRHCLSLICKIALLLSMVVFGRLQP